jgi:hypothetical protein
MMLGDCLWHVYALIGKLSRRIYLLSSPDIGPAASTSASAGPEHVGQTHNITMKPEPHPSLLHRIPDATAAAGLAAPE